MLTSWKIDEHRYDIVAHASTIINDFLSAGSVGALVGGPERLARLSEATAPR
jgi:hypothetical protein